jgi:hypothetical protein
MSVNSLPPNNLPLSFYLVKTCKLWVWDFDDTLINTETYLRRDMKTNTIRKLRDCDLDVDFPQWRYFIRLIDFLVTHGKYVGIASFGTYEIIRAYMDRIFGFNQKFFGKHNIMAPCLLDRDSRRFSVPPNKNEYIYQLMKIYRVQDFGRVVLFDDMPSNISSATSIGVIGVQIATPRNGDIDTKKMYFGPWIMDELDKKLESGCCNNKEKLTNVDGKGNNDMFLGDEFQYTQSAFGTGIGDRRISKKPDNRWNKMNVENPPIWQNGNWQTNGGTMTMESLPETSLGGYSLSFWDNDQSVIKKNIGGGSGSGSNNGRNNGGSNSVSISGSNISGSNIIGSNISDDYTTEGFESGSGNGSGSSNNTNNIKKISNNIDNYNKKYSKDIKDKFMDGDNCESCKKITWNWITLTLMVIIFMMVALCFSIM